MGLGVTVPHPPGRRSLEVSITIGELGEFGLIAALAARMPEAPDAIVGNGDDAAVLPVPDGTVVASTDLLVEGRHFRRDWSQPADVGVKAAAQNLADIAAMGAVPTALLVGLAAPPDVPATWALDLAGGLAAEAARAGAHVAGGDTSSADQIVIAVTALGTMAGRTPVTRSGARPTDIVAVTGRLGWSAAGLALLTAGLPTPSGPGASSSPGAPPDPGAPSGSGASSSSSTPSGPEAPSGPGTPSGPSGLAAVLAAHRRPQPPYPAGPRAAVLGATAMIDISDGLLADLGHLAESSGVLIDVDTTRLPLAAELTAAAQALGLESPGVAESRPGEHDLAAPGALAWVLTGGEDHALAATFPLNTVIPADWIVIGQVYDGRGVRVDGKNYLGNPGWQHFA